MRRLIFALAIVAAPMLVSAAALAPGDIKKAPPEPVYEVDPGPRPGYVLAPGYWLWDGKRHVWKASRWIAAREGFQWVPDQWEQRGDAWHLAPGHWVEDEAYEVVEERPEDGAAPANAKKKPSVKRVKRIDYNDTRKWPRVIHH